MLRKKEKGTGKSPGQGCWDGHRTGNVWFYITWPLFCAVCSLIKTRLEVSLLTILGGESVLNFNIENSISLIKS